MARRPSVRASKTERQGILFDLHRPKPPRPKKITQDQGAALLRRSWMKPDGSGITEEEADRWAGHYIRRCTMELTRLWEEPRPKKRPDRPTEAGLQAFVRIETDWEWRTAEARPVRVVGRRAST